MRTTIFFILSLALAAYITAANVVIFNGAYLLAYLFGFLGIWSYYENNKYIEATA